MPLQKVLKYFMLLLPLVQLNNLLAQKGAFGAHATLSEFTGDLNNNEWDFYQFKFNKLGIGASLQQNLSPSFNLMERLGYDGVQYQTADQKKGVDASMIGINLLLKYKFNNNILLKENAKIAPFLVVGVGGVQIDSKQFITKPAIKSAPIMSDVKGLLAGGGGITFRLSDNLSLELASIIQFIKDDTWDGKVARDNNDKYIQHSIGLIFPLHKNKDSDKDGVLDKNDECPNTPIGTKVDSKGCSVSVDSDGDGVPDGKDGCPNTPPGTKVDVYGCPLVQQVVVVRDEGDTDGDGVPNYLDKCKHTPPNTKVDYFGCPIDIPDSDGDGVNDDKDRCPGTPRGKRVGPNGCPIDVDSDGDGVPDSKDKCPNTKGEDNSQGCPEIKEEVKQRLSYATKNINFETGKYIITKNSYPVLDDVVKILGEYPDYSLRMGGHTDAVGSDQSNLVLSQKRVDAVKKYFVTKGISPNKIQATGYGESQPIASNDTPQGKAQNRRVELALFLP